jgi:cytochrome oxidase Cu insertion factor (SCO1/SenC/PrrC family)
MERRVRMRAPRGAWWLMVVVVMAGVLRLAGGLAGAAAAATAPQPPDPFAPMNVDRPAQEVRAPGFRLQSFEGSPLSLEDLRGKLVAFYFWRTW